MRDPQTSPPLPQVEPISVRIPEACRLTGIGRSKFYELIAAGEVEIVKVGAMTLVPMDGLRALVERGRRGRTTTNPTKEN